MYFFLGGGKIKNPSQIHSYQVENSKVCAQQLLCKALFVEGRWGMDRPGKFHDRPGKFHRMYFIPRPSVWVSNFNPKRSVLVVKRHKFHTLRGFRYIYINTSYIYVFVYFYIGWYIFQYARTVHISKIISHEKVNMEKVSFTSVSPSSFVEFLLETANMMGILLQELGWECALAPSKDSKPHNFPQDTQLSRQKKGPLLGWFV